MSRLSRFEDATWSVGIAIVSALTGGGGEGIVDAKRRVLQCGRNLANELVCWHGERGAKRVCGVAGDRVDGL